MVTFKTSQVNQLKRQLGVFDPANSNVQSPLLRNYLEFYGLPNASSQNYVTIGHLSVNQKPIFTAAWRPPNALGTALVVHGYMDHLGLYGHLINFLLSQKLAVVCFDLPGHGLSAGESGYIEDFTEYTDVLEELIELCQQQFPAPLYGLGQSMGGAVLLKHLINQGNQTQYPFKGLNLFAPLLHPKAWRTTRRFLPLVKLFNKSVKRVFRPSSYDLTFLDFLRTQDPLQPLTIPIAWLSAADKWVHEFESSRGSDFPLTIIQGNADKTLDWRYNIEAFTDKLTNLNLRMIDHANHHMVNEIEPLRRDIFQAIEL